MNNLQYLIKTLTKDGYDEISIPQLCYEYKCRYHVALDSQQMLKALVASGITTTYLRGDVLTLSALPIVTHFATLPQNKTMRALRGAE